MFHIPAPTGEHDKYVKMQDWTLIDSEIRGHKFFFLFGEDVTNHIPSRRSSAIVQLVVRPNEKPDAKYLMKSFTGRYYYLMDECLGGHNRVNELSEYLSSDKLAKAIVYLKG